MAIDESGQEAVETLRGLTGENCRPGIDSIEQLATTDLVLVSGQFVGAGKSTVIEALGADGYHNIASWTNRDLRPGEIEGVDKCQRPLAVMAERAVSGFFLELEEMRPGFFYATPSNFEPGKAYVKDLDLQGAVRLRTYAPHLPVIVPLPPLHDTRKGVTEWERRLTKREGFMARVDDKAVDDLGARLEGVVQEVLRIDEEDMVADPHTLFVVNDDLPTTVETVRKFLLGGNKIQDRNITNHLEAMLELAVEAVFEDE